MPTNIALHIEMPDGDVEEVKAATAKIAKSFNARSATVSTSAGTWDVLKPATQEAETVEGKKVTVKNPESYAAFPKKIERVAADPTPEQIREMRGEKTAKKGA